jgi:hypothetical protein
MTMSDISRPVLTTRLRQIWNQSWPQAMIGFGFALTIVWIFLLGEGLVRLINIALAKASTVIAANVF